jgi:Flp pilus assembly protein TadG
MVRNLYVRVATRLIALLLPARLRGAVRSERGATVVIFALILPAVLGMEALVIDGTRVFVERRALQNAADSAALAAAAFLPTSDAGRLSTSAQAAIDYAALNGFTITIDDITFSSESVSNDRVTVRTASVVQFFFAAGLGVPLGAVSSESAAQVGSVGGVSGVLPWGLEAPVGGFVFGQEYCLKLGEHSEMCSGATQGNFRALDIDNTGSSSGSIYRDKVRWGSNTVIRVGEQKNVAQGDMEGPTQQGLGCEGNNGRITGNNSTFSQVIEQTEDGYRVLDWSNTRLGLVPTVTYPQAQVAVVTGFAVFFIEGCAGGGAVTGRFIDTVVPGGEWMPYQPGYGTRVVRLVQ